MSDSSRMIQLFHVSKHYDRRTALSDITLDIEKGEFILLMGASGAGKSTLLRLLIGAEQPDEGQFFFKAEMCPNCLRRRFRI